MTELIAFLSTGKGTWGHVNRLLAGINGEKWEKVFLLTNDFGAQNFKPQEGQDNIELIKLDNKIEIQELENEILTKLKGKIKGLEVAVNFVSGDGREHMAFVSALMKLGLGFRLVALNKEGKALEI